MTYWNHFVDFWTGRYLYRESRRLAPFLFSKDEEESIDEMDVEEIINAEDEVDSTQSVTNDTESIQAESSDATQQSDHGEDINKHADEAHARLRTPHGTLVGSIA